MEENKLVRVGVSVILFKDDKVLLGYRKGAHGAGTWALPGGKMEYEEQPQVTACREVKEETGMTIGVPAIWKLHPFNSCVVDGQHWVTLFYDYRIGWSDKQEPVVVEPEKCEEWKWFSRFELPQPLFPPTKQMAWDSGWKII